MNCPGATLFAQGNQELSSGSSCGWPSSAKISRYKTSGASTACCGYATSPRGRSPTSSHPPRCRTSALPPSGLVFDIYRDFGFDRRGRRFPSTRSGHPRRQRDETWDTSKRAFRRLDRMGYCHRINPGEGAFYYQLEFVLRTPSAATGNAAPCRWTSTCPETLRHPLGTDEHGGERQQTFGHAHRALFAAGAFHRHPHGAPLVVTSCGWRPGRRWSSPITDSQADYARVVHKVRSGRRASGPWHRSGATRRSASKIREHTS